MTGYGFSLIHKGSASKFKSGSSLVLVRIQYLKKFVLFKCIFNSVSNHISFPTEAQIPANDMVNDVGGQC